MTNRWKQTYNMKSARTVCEFTDTSALPRSGWLIPNHDGMCMLHNKECFRKEVSGESQSNLWFSGMVIQCKRWCIFKLLVLSMKALSTLKSHAKECVNLKGNNCYISPPHSLNSLKGVIHHKLWPKKVQLQHFSEGLVSKSSLPNLGALLWVWFLQSAVS